MLAEHLSQAHDAASRRTPLIDAHVAWIHAAVLGGRPAAVLDLGCGPGLYLNRLAQLGHHGVGIDFSPASVAYARATAEAAGLAVEYRLQDLRTATFGAGRAAPRAAAPAAATAVGPGEGTPAGEYDLALLLYGEFNAFKPQAAREILQKAFEVLRPGGRLLLEPSTFESVAALGAAPAHWYAAETGLWAPGPHLVLQDNGWDAAHCVAVERFVVVDAVTGVPTEHAMTTQAYREEELRALLAAVGLVAIEIFPSLAPGVVAPQVGFFAMLAQKPG
jgi:SAM-dependent methyltransferase